MNFFYLHSDQKINAFSLCDAHRCRMIYESLQLLCNGYDGIERKSLSGIYKIGYGRHPCSLWVKKSIENWQLLHTYTGFLFESYYFHGGEAYQSGFALWKNMSVILPDLPSYGDATPPYLAFGSEDKQLNYKLKVFQQQVGIWNPYLKLYESGSFENAVQAYRTYYRLKQFKNNKFPKWTKNKQPDWYCRSEICVIGD